MKFSVNVPDNILNVISISDANPNYRSNGTVSSLEVELKLSELSLHKTCKSSSLGMLETKIEKTLFEWEKNMKHI
ncbi:MAG: hypothetical protein H6625_07315 [Bdellovibrionaceae bacterium]|nr:hypothetical protein [Pseudobdellovibrionaceae bacterium]